MDHAKRLLELPMIQQFLNDDFQNFCYSAASPAESQCSRYLDDQVTAWDSERHSSDSKCNRLEFSQRNVLDVPVHGTTWLPVKLLLLKPDEGPVSPNRTTTLGKSNNLFYVVPGTTANSAHAIALADALDNYVPVNRALNLGYPS